MRYLYATIDWPKCGKLTPPNADEDAEHEEHSFIDNENRGWLSHFGRQFDCFLQKKILLPYNLAITLLGSYPKKLNTDGHIKTCTQIFIVALFIIAKSWKQPRCPSVDE